MSKPQKEIDQTFIRVKRRWKWQRLAEQSAVVGIVASLLLVGLGAAVFRGWISEQSRCLLCLGVICGLGVIAETAVVMRVAERVPGRSRLAAALERVDRRFQDRLNTLLFIETVRAASGEHVFASRIAEQSQRLLRSRKATQPFRLTRTFGWCAGFAAVLAMTAFLGVHYSPWDKLRAASVPRGGTREPGPEFTTADVKSQDQPRPWGEVRITEPGGDLRVTKVDVVPLSIEVAANQDLKDVAWLSSVNGNPDQAHALPEPKEPRYALYQPSIYMDELQLSDWDVLTYYACARTKEPGAFVSEIYFIEVRPFREDILKLPGGEAGAPYQALNQISGLITRQQQVIRQTHQLPQPSAAPDSNREVSLKKLSGQEADLAKASQHLYA
ncbi:MAG TPA: hypothetical protein VKY92_25045, partial [Verrucomicrobiae bacterium]|nr:hypothetical protein [Verrucomicrobiae bacterium]